MQKGNIKFRRSVKNDPIPKADGMLSIATKIATLIPFFIISFGAIHLLSLSNAHGILFIDLVKSNTFLSFGSILFIYSVFLMLILSLTVISNHFINPIVTEILVQKTKIKIIKNHPYSVAFILSLTFSLWPFILLINASFTAIIIYLTTLSASVLVYHNIFTTDLTFVKIWKLQRVKGLLLLLSPVASILSVIITRVVFDTYIKQHKPSELNVIIVVSLVIFIMNLISFYLPSVQKKKESIPESIILTAFTLFMLLLIPSPMSSHTTETLFRSLGIGLGKRCFINEEVRKLPIPANLKIENNGHTELFVVANINDIYYISAPGDIDMIAQMRFVAENLTNISCSITKEFSITNNHLI